MSFPILKVSVKKETFSIRERKVFFASAFEESSVDRMSFMWTSISDLSNKKVF